MGTHELKIASKLEDMIELNCETLPGAFNEQDFRAKIIKWCYNSTDVIIDYKSKRIFMNLILDNRGDSFVDKHFGNELIPFILKYEDLKEFLKECIVRDDLSSKFYERIIFSGQTQQGTSYKKPPIRIGPN